MDDRSPVIYITFLGGARSEYTNVIETAAQIIDRWSSHEYSSRFVTAGFLPDRHK